MSVPSCVLSVVREYDSMCHILQSEAEDFWGIEPAEGVPVKSFYSKGTLRTALWPQGPFVKDPTAPQAVLFYSHGFSLMQMSERLDKYPDRKGIEMSYLLERQKDSILKQELIPGYILLYVTPVFLGVPFVEMRSKVHVVKEKARRVRQVHPAYLAEAMVLFSHLRGRDLLRGDKQKTGGYWSLEHVFFDQHRYQRPVRVSGATQNFAVHVVRITLESADLPSRGTGMCYRKLPKGMLWE